MARLAIVVENTSAAKAVLDALSEGGHSCRVWVLGALLMEELAESDAEMVIVDCSTPGSLNATFEALCNAVDVPVFALVPGLSDLLVVEAFGLGADGCLAKPYSSAALLAHVDAWLRRYWQWIEAAPQQAAGVDLDIDSHTVVIGERQVQLSETECRVLECLVENAGRVVSRKDLTTHAWGQDHDDISDASLNVTIYSLRKKLTRGADGPERIRTKWGVGYYWADA